MGRWIVVTLLLNCEDQEINDRRILFHIDRVVEPIRVKLKIKRKLRITEIIFFSFDNEKAMFDWLIKLNENLTSTRSASERWNNPFIDIDLRLFLSY